MAPALSTSMLTLSDSMVSNVEAAAQSSIGQCSWSVPITGSGWSSWLSSTMHQQHLPPRDGWVPRRCLGQLLCASRALQHALSGSVARSDDAVVRCYKTDGELVTTMSGHTDAVQCCAFGSSQASPCFLVTGSTDCTFRTWQ